MPTRDEMSREDKRTLYDVRKVQMLPDKDLREGLDDLINKIEAGMTKEDIAWVEQKLKKQD